MRTTVDIDPKLLADLVELTGEKRKSKALSKAAEEYIRRKRIDELLSMAGKIDIVDNWRELEELELEEMRRDE